MGDGDWVIPNDVLSASDRDAERYIGENLMECSRVGHARGEPGVFEDFECGMLSDIYCESYMSDFLSNISLTDLAFRF